MKFMMMVIGNEANWRTMTAEERTQVYETMGGFNQELMDAGVFVSGAGLEETSAAKTVRFGEGGPVASDGPFAEMKEAFAGYWVLEVPGMDDALAWAMRAPMGDGSAIEIRPIQDEV
jgi:hypothetical protein